MKTNNECCKEVLDILLEAGKLIKKTKLIINESKEVSVRAIDFSMLEQSLVGVMSQIKTTDGKCKNYLTHLHEAQHDRN
jgi:hypothetical protein